MIKVYFQLSYTLTFILCLIGILGNMELGIETPTPAIIITLISGFLTIEKFIYIYTLKQN